MDWKNCRYFTSETDKMSSCQCCRDRSDTGKSSIAHADELNGKRNISSVKISSPYCNCIIKNGEFGITVVISGYPFTGLFSDYMEKDYVRNYAVYALPFNGGDSVSSSLRGFC